VFRVRAGRIDERQLVTRLERQGFRLTPVEGLTGFFRVEDGPRPVSLTLEHWSGLIYVQQASTGAAPPMLGVKPGERVLDLCAAPGGKSTHLAELMDGRGCLVASEVDERRIRGLLGNVYRLCQPNIMVVAADGRAFPEGARFDRVLVDAPCSGEGTLRRRAGEAPNQSRSFLRYVTKVQRALLEKAIRLTRPGGTVLYVTCTFAPEENEAVVSDILAGAPVELEWLEPSVPHARGLTAFDGARFDPRVEGAVRIYPHLLDSGGLFMAKLRRLDGAAVDGDVGWKSVPSAFPGEALAEEDARGRVMGAIEVVAGRYGMSPERLAEWRWTLRGGKVWLHTIDEWPLEAWDQGSWRPISIGLRALEFDSADRPRPTNDFLRLASSGVGSARVDLSVEELQQLLSGDAQAVEGELRGPVALAYGHEVVGRGALGEGGLVSEIPKARAADLRRALASDSGG
jgi:NOL1/NOP2/sun family putative RNA methylase